MGTIILLLSIVDEVINDDVMRDQIDHSKKITKGIVLKSYKEVILDVLAY